MFQKGQIVWAHIQGYPLWPATVIKVITNSPDNIVYYKVSFFGESTRATLRETDVFQFDTRRPEFTPNEDILKKHKLLKRALKSAAAKLQESQSKFQGSDHQQNKSAQEVFPLETKAQPSKKKSKQRSAPEQRCVSPEVIVQENHRKTSPLHGQSVGISTIRESPMEQEESSPKRATTNRSHKSPQKLSKQGKSPSNWQLALSSEVLEELCCSIEKRSSNPVKAEIDRVPTKSFFYEQLPQRLISPPASNTNSLLKSKRQRLAEKMKEKEEYKVQQLSKTLSNYMTFLPDSQNTPEVMLARQVQFKLECIVFLIMDTASTSNPLNAKLKQLRSILDIERIGPGILMDSKISSLLSFILKKLKEEFEEDRRWISESISTINKKVLGFMNSTQFYDKALNATKNFAAQSGLSLPVGNFNAEKNELKQKLEVRHNVNGYKSRIKDMLRLKKGFSEEDAGALAEEMVDYLGQEGPDLEDNWEKLRGRVDGGNDKGRNQRRGDLKQFVLT